MPTPHRLTEHVNRVHDAHRAAHEAADAHGTEAHARLEAERANSEPLPTSPDAGAPTKGPGNVQGE